MASTPRGNGSQPPLDPNQKTLNVWSKPIDEQDAANPHRHPTIADAVSTIKMDDFANVANTPCARNGLLTGIASGFGVGGLRFILSGKIGKSTNWAAGFFVLGSVASYEYCQYLRRCERRQMKRHIEVINEGRKEQAKKRAEEKWEQHRTAEAERQAEAQKRWYKFW